MVESFISFPSDRDQNGQAEFFVPVRHQLPKDKSAGPAFKYFYVIHGLPIYQRNIAPKEWCPHTEVGKAPSVFQALPVTIVKQDALLAMQIRA